MISIEDHVAEKKALTTQFAITKLPTSYQYLSHLFHCLERMLTSNVKQF